MKITFPGTGAGTSSLKTFHSSLLLQDEKNILIDAGDGISKALLSLGIEASEIDKIIISHLHADHFSGLASLVTQMKLQNRTTPLEIFIHPLHIDNTKLFLNMSNLFTETFDFKLDFFPIEFNKKHRISNSVELIPYRNSHITNKHSLIGYEKIPFISSSFKLITPYSILFYTADIAGISDFDNFDLIDVDVLITEVCHINFEEILEYTDNLNLKKLFLTHIPDELREDLTAKVEQIKSTVNFEVFVADDGNYFEL